MKNTKSSQAIDSKNLAVELSNFNFELQDYEEGQKIYVVSYNWTRIEDWKTGTSFKYFGLLGDENKLKFKEFKARNEMKVNWSLAIFWRKGLLKTAQAAGLITEELDLED